MERLWHNTPSEFKGVVVALLLGYFLNPTLSETFSENGVVTSCSYIGIGNILGGGLAIYLSIRIAREGVRSKPIRSYASLPPGLIYGVAAISLVLGVLMELKGWGLIASPCDDELSSALLSR